MARRFLGFPITDEKDLRRRGRDLASWLNGGYDNAAPWNKVVYLLKELQEFASAKPTRRVALAADLKLDLTLREFTVYPRLYVKASGQWGILWSNKSAGMDHAGTLLSLMMMGLVHRIRECKTCSNRFYADRDNSFHCSEKCWLEMYRSRPTYAKRNRKYQKKYYDTHLRKTDRKRRKK